MKTNKIPASLKTINLEHVLRRQGWYEKQTAWQETMKLARPMARKMIAKRKAEIVVNPHDTLSAQQITDYVEKQIHLIHIIQDKFDTKLQQFIAKMVDGFLANLETEIAHTKSIKNKDDSYFADNESDLQTQAQLDFSPLLNDLATLAGAEALQLIGSKEIYLPFDFKKIIAANIEKFTQSMIDTDRETLINIVSDGIANGESTAAIRGAIQADFENITKSQATRVTKTEVSRISNQSAIDAWKQSGVVEGLQWTVVSPVDECADYDGQIRSIDDTSGFYDVQNDFQDGDPPLHPNCECQLIPIVVGS